MGTNLMQAHEQWRTRPADERFESLAELHDAVHKRRMASQSWDLDVLGLNVTDQAGTLLINAEDGKVIDAEPTHWAFGQMAQIIGAPANYLRTLPRPLLVDNFNHGLKESDSESFKFMTVGKDTGENTLQAVTSSTYGRIWDADVIDGVQRIVERSGGKWHNPPAYQVGGGEPRPSGLYASDHDIFVFMIDGGSFLESGDRAKLHRGFIVANSEVGAKAFWLMTFLHNGVCGNHIIWGASEVNKLLIRHTSGGPTRFDNEAAKELKAYVEAPVGPIEATIKRAQNYLVVPKELETKSEETILDFVNKQAKFSRGEVKNAIAFAKSEEGEAKTLWQIVQGFTAYARGFDWVDARVDLERRAGSLLDIVADKNQLN